jgi:NADH dehydrogenase [ubiquinone] 1 alpha subcomplex assembly factor 7
MLQKLQHHNLKWLDEDDNGDGVEKRTISTLAGTLVSWHALLEQVPSGCM